MTTDAFSRFMAMLAHLTANRPDVASVKAYERLKREFVATCPGATPQQYETAMQAIARATGV